MVASIRVPPPGGLSTRSVPPSASTLSARPAQAEATSRIGAADAVVGHLDRKAAVGPDDPDRDPRGGRVLGDVRERFRAQEVGGGLRLRRDPSRQDVELDGHRAPIGKALHRPLQTFLDELARMKAEGQFVEVVEGALELSLCFAEVIAAR